MKNTLRTKDDNFTTIPDHLFQLPQNVTIKKGSNGYGLFALKDFKAGDVVYEFSSIILPYNEAQRVISLPLCNNLTHTVYIHAVPIILGTTQWEYFGFDSYMNHSCLPNVLSITIDDNKYKNIAIRKIKIDEEITCNYNLCYWDFSLGRIKNIVCNCQAPNCAKEIKGFLHLSFDAQNLLLPYNNITSNKKREF